MKTINQQSRKSKNKRDTQIIDINVLVIINMKVNMHTLSCEKLMYGYQYKNNLSHKKKKKYAYS